MLNFLRKHKLIIVVFGMALIYTLQFLVFPLGFPQFYPVSNEAWAILIIPLGVFSIAMNILTDINIRKWVVADGVYCLMVMLYNGTGLYGIGKRGMALDGMTPIYSVQLALITIMAIAFLLVTFQMLTRGIRLLILKLKMKQ